MKNNENLNLISNLVGITKPDNSFYAIMCIEVFASAWNNPSNTKVLRLIKKKVIQSGYHHFIVLPLITYLGYIQTQIPAYWEIVKNI